MGLVKGLLSERAQAVAADMLFLATLISISSAMLFVFGTGARQADTHAVALQQRYVAELVQGVLLSSRYMDKGCNLTVGENYTLGLGGVEKDRLTRISTFTEGLPLEGNPLERKICGSIFDLIGDDLIFGLTFRWKGAELAPNKALVGEGYHEGVDRFIKERFEKLAPGIRYRISARYNAKPPLSDIVYAEVNYTNTKEAPSGGVYAARFHIPVSYEFGPLECAGLESLDLPAGLEEYLEGIGKLEMHPTALVEIQAWPVAEGDSEA